MLYTLSLLTLLVAMAGVIAYAGDVLGTTIGRRRLSLFGWRPKRTGQVVGIAVGILIMLVTLSILAVAFRGAAAVLLDAQRTADEIVRLREELRVLTAQVTAMEASLADANDEIDAARAERNAAFIERDEALAERSRLQQEAAGFSNSVLDLQAEIAELDSNLLTVQQELDTAQASLADIELERDNALQDLAEANQAVDTAEADVTRLRSLVAQATNARNQALQDVSELTSTQLSLEQQASALEEQVTVLRSNLQILQDQTVSLETINAQLLESNRSLRVANSVLIGENDTLRSNVGDLDSRVLALEDQLNSLRADLSNQADALLRAREQVRAVSDGALTFEQNEEIYRAVVSAQNPGDIQRALAEAVTTASSIALGRGAGELRLSIDTVNALVEGIATTEGSDLLRFVSPTDQYGPSTLEVNLDLRENERLLDAGQLLVSRPIFLGEGDNSKSDTALRDDVTRLSATARQSLQALGYSGNSTSSLPTAEVETLLAWLNRLSGEAVVGVVAKEPVYVAGDAQLEFVIVR
ncbi:MAG: DUF3084 domain-containing protein [Deinococcota bacterium]